MNETGSNNSAGNVVGVCETFDNNDTIFLYFMIAVEAFNLLISLFTSYKLNHMDILIDHIDCCCCAFDNVHIDISDESNDIIKTNG